MTVAGVEVVHRAAGGGDQRGRGERRTRRPRGRRRTRRLEIWLDRAIPGSRSGRRASTSRCRRPGLHVLIGLVLGHAEFVGEDFRIEASKSTLVLAALRSSAAAALTPEQPVAHVGGVDPATGAAAGFSAASSALANCSNVDASGVAPANLRRRLLAHRIGGPEHVKNNIRSRFNRHYARPFEDRRQAEVSTKIIRRQTPPKLALSLLSARSMRSVRSLRSTCCVF